jgi:hypothetical protein
MADGHDAPGSSVLNVRQPVRSERLQVFQPLPQGGIVKSNAFKR